MTTPENIQKALDWLPPTPERVIEIRFGVFREHRRLFVSASVANLFRDYLRGMGMSHDITERDYNGYERVL